jgi:myo-inositol catabolism protein IolC
MTAPSWQPRHDDPLLILAMDHRGSFGKTLFDVVDDKPTNEQRSSMQKAKKLIYQGLLRAAPQLSSGRAGVLVDEQYGQHVIDRSVHDPVVLAIPIEASGHDWFTLQWGDKWLEHVRDPAYVKVLVRDNPDFAESSRVTQLESLATVSSLLQSEGFALLYELLVPATKEQLASIGDSADRYDAELRPELTVRVLADNQSAGVDPVLWKIEGLETVAAARAVADQARSGGRRADLIVLGRDAPAARIDHWLSVASQVPEFVGFAIGRSIWQDTIGDWHQGRIDDERAVAAIAKTYLDFAGQWKPAAE